MRQGWAAAVGSNYKTREGGSAKIVMYAANVRPSVMYFASGLPDGDPVEVIVAEIESTALAVTTRAVYTVSGRFHGFASKDAPIVEKPDWPKPGEDHPFDLMNWNAPRDRR